VRGGVHAASDQPKRIDNLAMGREVTRLGKEQRPQIFVKQADLETADESTHRR
jgi:hypothetical protein